MADGAARHVEYASLNPTHHASPSRPAAEPTAKIATHRVATGAWVLCGIVLVSLAVSITGITWGAPSVWHPDELVYRVNHAIVTGYDGFFDRTNFDYPSLPKHIMYGLGRLVYAAGGTAETFVLAARLVSAGLGGVVVILAYLIAVQAGATWRGAAVAALLTGLCSLLVINTHFAHNDAYLVAFTTLAVYCVLRYQAVGNGRWLWWSFAAVGLAASSKYNGASLAVVPILAGVARRGTGGAGLARLASTMGIGIACMIAAYVTGTPRALIAPADYVRGVWPALLNHRNFDRTEDSVVGALGQWAVMAEAFGMPMMVLAAVTCLWSGQMILTGRDADPARRRSLTTIAAAGLALNAPLWFSYNYPPRFLLPLVPLLGALVGIAFDSARAEAGKRRLRSTFGIACMAVIAYSGARSVSVALLFLNDARITLGQTIDALPADAVIAYGGRFGQGGFGGGHTFFKLALNIAAARQVGPFPDNWRLTYLPGQAQEPRRPEEIANEVELEQSCA